MFDETMRKGIHEFMVRNYSVKSHHPNTRDQWVAKMKEYYTIMFPGCKPEIYERWAIGYIDTVAASLGDYFSRSYYDSER